MPEDNIILLRKWEDYGTRYGEPEEIFGELLEELDALYDEKRLAELVREAQTKSTPEPKRYFKVSVDDFRSKEDWKDPAYGS